MFENIIPYTYLDGRVSDWYTEPNGLQYSGTFVGPDTSRYVAGAFTCISALTDNMCCIVWHEHYFQDSLRDDEPSIESGVSSYILDKKQYTLKKLKYRSDLLQTIEIELENENHFAIPLIRDCENGFAFSDDGSIFDADFQMYHALKVMGFV